MRGLLFITHRTENYDYLQSVEIGLQGGCRQIQLRMKDAGIMEFEEVAIQTKKLCDEYGADLYINDFPEVCRMVNATGVHLGKSDMSPADTRMMLGDKYFIGGTANTFDDIQRLSGQGVNYIGLGPFRFTTTKKNLSPVLGLEGYCHIVRLCQENDIHIPLLAIGGITIADIPSIMQTGVSGIALSSAILSAKKPVDALKEVLRLMSYPVETKCW